MELSNMSLAQLRNLEEEVIVHLRQREQNDRKSALEQIYAIADSVGMPLKTLFGKGAGRKAARAATPYRDPSNPSNKWIGRGPRPTWLKAALANGQTLDQFRL